MNFNLPKKISAKVTTVIIHQIFTATFLPYSSTYYIHISLHGLIMYHVLMFANFKILTFIFAKIHSVNTTLCKHFQPQKNNDKYIHDYVLI